MMVDTEFHDNELHFSCPQCGEYLGVSSEYLLEKTCEIVGEEVFEIPCPDSWYGMLDTGISRYKLSCGHEMFYSEWDEPKHCAECGAKILLLKD